MPSYKTTVIRTIDCVAVNAAAAITSAVIDGNSMTKIESRTITPASAIGKCAPISASLVTTLTKLRVAVIAKPMSRNPIAASAYPNLSGSNIRPAVIIAITP